MEVFLWADNLEPDNITILNQLALTSYESGNKKDSYDYVEKSLALDANSIASLLLIAQFYQLDFKLNEAEHFLKRAIEYDGDCHEAYAALGHLYSSSGNTETAIKHLNKSIKIEPDHSFSKEILARIYKKSKDYIKAINFYKEGKFVGWEENVLECLYFSKQYDEFERFYDENDDILKFSRQSSAILNHAKYHLEIFAKEQFCNDPFEYIHYKDFNDIDGLPNFNERLIREFSRFNMDSAKRKQGLLKNGTQSAINIFQQGSDLFKVFENFITNEANKYVKTFAESNDIFIKNWPNNFKLNGWFVQMSKGGFLDSHNHPAGWLSGIYYLKIPKKIKKDDANIRFCLSNKNFPHSTKNFSEQELEVNTIESRFILFPSSVYHYTTPYEADDDRICISFDFQPIAANFAAPAAATTVYVETADDI
jgi:uncharacterized protein (TIGR02466 family)